MSKFGISTLDSADRVRIGVKRENEIAEALRDQAGLDIRDASADEDKGYQKIDRWLVQDGQRHGMQIKFRQTGSDILFEVFDTFHGFGDVKNKKGRDMIGRAEYYTVLASDQRTAYVVPVAVAHEIINDAMNMIQEFGWTLEQRGGSVFKWFKNGHKIEIRLTTDPKDGRPKIVAFIPPGVFEVEKQVMTYRLKLPKMAA
jgi:hypothetical protein